MNAMNAGRLVGGATRINRKDFFRVFCCLSVGHCRIKSVMKDEYGDVNGAALVSC